jgi:hypothetical protein
VPAVTATALALAVVLTLAGVLVGLATALALALVLTLAVVLVAGRLSARSVERTCVTRLTRTREHPGNGGRYHDGGHAGFDSFAWFLAPSRSRRMKFPPTVLESGG